MCSLPADPPTDEIDFAQFFNFIAKKFNPDGRFRKRSGNNFNNIASDPEGTAMKIDLIALVLDLNQPIDNLLPAHFHACAQR